MARADILIHSAVSRWTTVSRWLPVLLSLFSLTAVAHAGGPRYVGGPPYFNAKWGQPIGWKQPTLLYSTDPGPLSGWVTHAQADAIVAAAADAWNVPAASVSVAEGAPLAEDVNGENVYLGSSGVVFPADVMSANAANVPLAIVYDADGTVTETLLGSGASAPAACHQNAVTETVDAFDPAGYILHAIIVVNGRCTGPVAAQQLQLRYQLERIVGRVLGLAWSQANDNVYTGTPAPTAQQQAHWPILHPLDILCGPYSYQCLPQPFTLRPDDIAALVGVYPNVAGTVLPPGKQVSLTEDALGLATVLRFPTGEGMGGVNVVVQLAPTTSSVEPWVTASGVTGSLWRRADTSPFVTGGATPADSFGAEDTNYMGYVLLPYLALPSGSGGSGVVLTSEAINPLYTGAYSLSTDALGTVAPSGSPLSPGWAFDGGGGTSGYSFTVGDAAANCGSGSDGTFAAPMQMPSSGWWHGQLCGYGHASYVRTAVKPGRSLTVEVTALDANGLATTTKARPVMGLYAPSDTPSTLPSVAVAAQAFQALTVGTTTLTAATGQLTSLILGIADQRGDGRPDYTYQARLFYADSIGPDQVTAAGAQAVVSGLGFRPGNVVTVNGVGAVVSGWTENTIVLTLPAMAVAHASSGTAVDVTVSDLSTGATSTMTGAVTYLSTQTPPPTMRVLTAPAGPVSTGQTPATPFAIVELAPDGVTPVAGEPVQFTLGDASAASTSPGTLSACGGPACTVTTDASGKASVLVTPLQAGTAILTASDTRNTAVSVSAAFQAIAAAGAMVVTSTPAGAFYNTQPAGTFGVQMLSAAASSAPAPGRSVTFQVTAGVAQIGSCAAQRCTEVTDANGMARVAITPESTGSVTVQATDGALTRSVTLNVLSWADTLILSSTPMSGQLPGNWAGAFAVRLVHGDGVTPDAGASVVVSAPAAVVFSTCGATTCTLTTNQDGTASALARSSQAGTFSLTASAQGQTVTASFSVLSPAPQLQLVSVPASPSPVGVATAQPFAVRLVDALDNPLSLEPVSITGPQGEATLAACGGGNGCTLFTAADGTISSTVTPLVGGSIPLSAYFGSVMVSVEFTSVGALRTLRVLEQPGAAGALVNQLVTFQVQILGPDGVTPEPGESLLLNMLAGQISIRQCQTTTCVVSSDQNGMATFEGTPIAPGAITLQAMSTASRSATALISFVATAPPDVLTLVGAPASGSVAGSAAATPFSVRVYTPDSVTAEAGRAVTMYVAAGAAGFGACGGAATCVLTSDVSGLVSSGVTPLSAGAITLMAAEGGGSVTASFNAAAAAMDTLVVVSAPGGSSPVGQANATPFTVKILWPDGATPAAGRSVGFSVGAGQAALSACTAPAPPCAVMTDVHGLATTFVTPAAAGLITVAAAEAGVPANAASVSFNAVSVPVTPPPVPSQELTLVQSPGAGVFTGITTAMPLSVRLTRTDGVTPVAGVPVTFSAAASGTAPGSVLFVTCGAAVCTQRTDANGLASTAVTGGAAGALTLSAMAPSPGVGLPAPALSLTFQVNADQLSLTPVNPRVFVAPATPVTVALNALASENGILAAGASVTWSSPGSIVSFSATPTATGVDGLTSVVATLPALAAGMQASVSACAQFGSLGSACAGFTATAVPNAQLGVTIVAGGLQTIAAATAAPYAPVMAQVTDAAGDPVLGATVTIYQTVTEADAACPGQGRCPTAPVLASQVATAMTDAQGRIQFQPLTLGAPGLGVEQTQVALAAGAEGFTSTVLTMTP